jgi:hypothetical protein
VGGNASSSKNARARSQRLAKKASRRATQDARSASLPSPALPDAYLDGECQANRVAEALKCPEQTYLPQRFMTAFVTASRTASWRIAHWN